MDYNYLRMLGENMHTDCAYRVGVPIIKLIMV